MSKTSLSKSGSHSNRASKTDAQVNLEEDQKDGDNDEDGEWFKEEGEGEEGEECEEEEVIEVEVEEPYCPPNPNFIHVLNADGEKFIVNPNCSKIVFLEYIEHKMGLGRDSDIDFCDPNGTMVGISDIRSNDYLKDVFEVEKTYAVCCLTRNQNGEITEIQPLLHDSETRFPEMQSSLDSNYIKRRPSGTPSERTNSKINSKTKVKN